MRQVKIKTLEELNVLDSNFTKKTHKYDKTLNCALSMLNTKTPITIEMLEETLLSFAGTYLRTEDHTHAEKCNRIRKCLIELQDMHTLLELKDMTIRTQEKEINRLLEEKRLTNYKLDCENCKYHITLEELKKLSDEDSLEMFNKCSNCSNYSDSLFESK